MSDQGSERDISEYDSEDSFNEFEDGDNVQDEFVDDYDDEFDDDDDDEDRRRRKPRRHGKTKDDTRMAIFEDRAKRIGTLQHGPEAGVTITGSTYRQKVAVSDEVFGPPLNLTGQIDLMKIAAALENFYKFRGCYREVVGAEVK